MKSFLLIFGIVSLAVCALSLLFSAFNRFGYYHVLDGSPDLYTRLRRRMVTSLAVGIVFAVVGTVCIFISILL